MLHVDLICAGEIDADLTGFISEGLARELGAEVAPPETAAVPRKAYNAERHQYSSTTMLKTLLPRGSPRGRISLVITDVDLYVPELNFVFGEAHPGAGVCVISLARLGLSFDGKPVVRALLVERALKEAVHEIGHLLGLGHCARRTCVMFFSNSLMDTDRKSHRLCSDCLKKAALAGSAR